MTKYTFIVEIGTEELPPKLLYFFSKSFAKNISYEFDLLNLNYGKIDYFSSPRRLAVKIYNISKMQNDRNIRIRGPSVKLAFDKNGNFTNIAKIWAKNCDIEINKSDRIITNNGEWLACYKFIKGLSTKKILCEAISKALNNISSSKKMKLSKNNFKFIRPIHTITMLLDNYLIPGKIFDIKIDRVLLGHRFMGDKKIILENANHYPEILLSYGKVIADYNKRKEIIYNGIKRSAKKINGIVNLKDNDLLEEVTSLVEWPVVLIARFEKKFLKIPIEIIVYIMKNYQKYFPVYDKKGNLLPYFIFIANIESKDPQKIISGNEKVMRSRLSDAEFFFNMDCKNKLENNLFNLNKVLFQEQLGNLFEKSKRIEYLSSFIASHIGADKKISARAGLLSKCDLLTKMVLEFSDTQGVMGMYYAKNDGELKDVYLAIREQYNPKFFNDSLPTTLISCSVSIADKIDNIVGIFGINQFPTGNRDPFALRRSAIGILRIIINKKLSLDIKELVKQTINLYGSKLTNKFVEKNVMDFIFERCRSWYIKQGFKSDVIKSVLVCKPNKIIDINARILAVSWFSTLNKSILLSRTSKRLLNILSKSNISNNENLNISLLHDPLEIELFNNFKKLNIKLRFIIEKKQYKKALIELIKLQKYIDKFFNNVLIMSKNYKLKVNRLILIKKIHELFLSIADISVLQN